MQHVDTLDFTFALVATVSIMQARARDLILDYLVACVGRLAEQRTGRERVIGADLTAL
jgi:hypothetical protein